MELLLYYYYYLGTFTTLEMGRRVSYIIDDYLSSKNIVLKDNTIVVQPDIIGLIIYS